MGDDNLLSKTVASFLINGIMNGIMNAPLKGEKITFCIKVLLFKEIQKDIKLECEKYGKVIAGMGNTYVLFDSVDDVKNIIRNICYRRFNDRLIRIIYYEEEKFDKKILKIMKKV